MSSKFNPKDLDPAVLRQVLEPLSGYYISKRRLKIHETTLGRGGFGTVKLADLWPTIWIPFFTLPTAVAVKELQTDNQDGVPSRTAIRLAREMKVWVSCKHENILEFTGYYLSEDFRTAYLVSPYMTNGNIKDYLSREAPSQERRLELVLDTITGLVYLHSRDPPIVHGDLKSLNVLVNNKGKARLADFGLAKVMEGKPTGLTTSNGFKGTLRYCSPEVLDGSPRDFSSDIWSWGCLTLEIITDNPPYHEMTDTQVLLSICGPKDNRKTPEPSDTSTLPFWTPKLLRMCWSFEPGQRPNAWECVDEVETRHRSPMLVNFFLPVRLFTPSARLNLSVEPEDWNDLVYGVSIARLSLRDTDMVVMVESFDIGFRSSLRILVVHLNQRWALQHENLLELTGYSMDLGLGRFYVMSPYMGQIVLLQYLRRNRNLAPGAKLKLLQDMLKGLVYLHSFAHVVHGALNPWTIVVNGEGKAVLPLIGSFIPWVPDYQVRAGLSERPTHLWLGPEAEPTTSWARSGSDIWAWACIVLQVICESRQYDGTSIHSPKFMESMPHGENPEPDPVPILHDRLLGLLRSCWNRNRYERPSASDCLDVLDLVIQGEAELAAGEVTITGLGMA